VDQEAAAGRVRQDEEAAIVGTPSGDVSGKERDSQTGSDATLPGDTKKDEEGKRLGKMGMMTAIAIGLHNFPEGLATFVAALADTSTGLAIAVAITLHNIPEGLCVAMPVYYSTGSKWKGIMWAAVSASSEPLGALLGYAVLANSFSDLVYAILFCMVGGMMVYISVRELMPTALRHDPEDKVTSYCCFAGMAVMATSLLLFDV
jgi:ZIP family zinc transporter